MSYGVGLTNGEKSKMFTCRPLLSTLLSLFLSMTRIGSLNVLRPYPFTFRPPSLLISFQPSHLSSLRLRNLHVSHKRTTVSMTSGGFFESPWACGIINAHTLDPANDTAPACTPPLALIGRKSTDAQVVTVLLAMHFPSWTLVGRGPHVFKN